MGTLCNTNRVQPADSTIEATWPAYLRAFKDEVLNSFLLEHLCSGRHLYGVDTIGDGVDMEVDLGGISGLPLSPYAGLLIKVLPIATNTDSGVLTVNVGSSIIASGPLKLNGLDLPVGVIAEAQWIEVVWDGTNWQVVSGFKPILVQKVRATLATSTTTIEEIPDDDTIPQNDEGTEILTVTITPAAATNRLIISAIVHHAINNQSSVAVMALFKDSVVDALAAVSRQGEGQNRGALTMFHEVVAGGTSAITFKLRVGTTGSTMTINGQGGDRKFGGVQISGIWVEEIRG